MVAPSRSYVHLPTYVQTPHLNNSINMLDSHSHRGLVFLSRVPILARQMWKISASEEGITESLRFQGRRFLRL